MFIDYFELEMEFDDAETCSALFLCLESLVAEAKNITTEKGEMNFRMEDETNCRMKESPRQRILIHHTSFCGGFILYVSAALHSSLYNVHATI